MGVQLVIEQAFDDCTDRLDGILELQFGMPHFVTFVEIYGTNLGGLFSKKVEKFG